MRTPSINTEDFIVYLGFDPQLVWLCPNLHCIDSLSNKWCNNMGNRRYHPNDKYFILLQDLEMGFKALVAYEDKGV